MRNTVVMERSSKHKKKCRSPSVVSSEEASSESDEKLSRNVETKRRHSSNSSDSSPERVKKHKKKKKKHKRKHKQSESEDGVEEVHIEKSNSPELVELEQGRGRRPYSEEGEASPEVERRDVNRRKDEDRRRHEQRRRRDEEVGDERRDLSRRNVDEERRRPEKRREDISESYAAVRIKHEPVDEDDNRMRHSHSSSRHRPTDGRQRERSDNAEYQSSRHRHHRGEGHRSRPQDRGDQSSSRPDESGDRGHDSRRHNEDRPRYAAADSDEPAGARPAQREQRRQSEERTNDGADRGRPERGGRGRGRGGGSRFNAKAERGGGGDDAGGGTFEWGKTSDNVKQEAVPPGEKEKPDFGTSGKLTAEANTFKGVVIKYSEPPEARKPRRRWRFYPFKGEKGLQTLYIHRQSSYLVGRDRKIADIPVDHPSCSKQHAALQYRLVPFERENGTTGKRVRPYIIDLESANGTFVNNVRIDAKKYVELLERDVVKFGFSSREYVLLHEHSKDDDYDDVGDIEEGPEVEAGEVIREVAEGTQRAPPVRLQPLAPLIE